MQKHISRSAAKLVNAPLAPRSRARFEHEEPPGCAPAGHDETSPQYIARDLTAAAHMRT